jgi:four helix bundle protein
MVDTKVRLATGGFEDLDVFRRAYRVSLEVHRVSLTFPAIEQRVIADQMRRASKGICANLAEGHGKQSRSKAEFRRFVQMALGSSNEMRVWLRYAHDLDYIDAELWRRLSDEYHEIGRMLRSLSRAAQAGPNL